MKQIKFTYASIFAMLLVFFSTPSAGEEAKRVWQTSVCYHFRLSVWDKMNQGNYHAKYIVTSSDGRVFVAEKNATEDSNTAEVAFPDNFRDEKNKLKAWINCRYGESYMWDIYANGALIDSGTIAVSRKKSK
jgi:hypothetical protein